MTAVAGSVSRRAVVAGGLAALFLTMFYVGVVWGVSGSPAHLGEQTRRTWYLLVPLLLGFGAQVALFVELRQRHRLMGAAAAVGATGAGASAAGMVACCAHHLADLAPFAGATGAATLIGSWQVPLMLAGLGATFVGIGVAGRRLQRGVEMQREVETCALG